MQKTTFIVEASDNDIKIEKLLKKYYNFSYNTIQYLMRKGNIKINNKRQKQSCVVYQDDIIELYTNHKMNLMQTQVDYDHQIVENLMNNLLYKDDDVLIFNKPSGLAVQGGTNIKANIDSLSHYFQFDSSVKPKLVHRIDRDTSGILVMARNSTTARTLCEMFKNGAIKKNYLAICCGIPCKLRGIISIPIAKTRILNRELMYYSKCFDHNAISHYNVLDYNYNCSLLNIQIITGKTHQIRAHCAITGIPILGDLKYNHKYTEFTHNMFSIEEKKQLILNSNILINHYDKLCLHSYQIEFILNHRQISIMAKIPAHFEDAINDKSLKLN